MSIFIWLIFPITLPIFLKILWSHKITMAEMTAQIFIVCLVVSGIWFFGKFSKSVDVEILNGKITSKSRVHDHYLDPYDCNCVTTCDSSGNNCSKSCDTCYEDRYTVDWFAMSTVGKIRFQSYDWGSSRVYNEPNPPSYENCVIGEPASLENKFTNYIKAVPESLFNSNSENNQYLGKIPHYPRVHDFYKINRVLNVDTRISNDIIKEINSSLSNSLIHMGYSKQVNINLILTEIDDSMYRYAIEDKWVGGKKNDVTVIVGVDENVVTWADVMTFASNYGNEELVVNLRDSIVSYGKIDLGISNIITNNINEYFTRPKMVDFEYVKTAIEPSKGIIIFMVIVMVVLSVVLSIFFYKNYTI